MGKNRNSNVKMPKNLNRPFFTYGAFKPNQVGYKVIQKHIENSNPATVNGALKQRNGVPMFIKNNSRRQTKGFIHYFKNSNEVNKNSDVFKAYKLISESRKGSLFKWDTISINGKQCNVLVGKDENLAEDYDIKYTDEYDGSTEICFTKEDIDYVKNLIEKLNPDDTSNQSIFEHEMVYMLIWSFIDKFLSLSYGGHNQARHINNLSKRDDFKESLKRTHIDYGRIAHDTKTDNFSMLNPKKSQDTIWYYYLLRCNITHGGKHNSPNVRKQLTILKKSSSELIEIISHLFDLNFGRL